MNMCAKLNSIQRASEFPLAAKAVSESYIDDGLTGADSIEEVIRLQRGVQGLFTHAVFLLGKWNLSDLEVLQHIPSELRDSHTIQEISDTDNFAKTLGIEWNTHEDCFCLSIGSTSLSDTLTKRKLVSNITKTFGVLGLFATAIITMKILPQQVWEAKVEWDDPVPVEVRNTYQQWRPKLNLLSSKHISGCHYAKEAQIVLVEIHGFSDASELA